MTRSIMDTLRRKRPHARPVTDEYYRPQSVMQWWYFDAVLDTGHRLMTFFLPRYVGRIYGHDVHTPLVDVVTRDPNGRTLRERRFFRPDEIVASSNHLDIEFGKDCSLRMTESPAGSLVPPRYAVRARIGGIELDLELIPELPSWSPFGPSGGIPRYLMMAGRRSLFTRDRFQYVSFVPRGRLSGTVRIGGTVVNASGLAYHEQGIANFNVNEFVPEWNWLHIEHPPWTIICSAARLPPGFPTLQEGPTNGSALVYNGPTCVMSAFDLSGLFVRWKQVERRAAGSTDDGRIVWRAVTELRRPGFRARIDLEGKDVFEYIPFQNENGNAKEGFWGLAIAKASISLRHGSERHDFNAEAILETMHTGGQPRSGRRRPA